MSPKIGFVLLTHNKPSQAIRLVTKLNRMFDAPPICWHHDFTQCDIPPDSITENVSLVRPHFRTGWALFAVVDAMLAALKLHFRAKTAPDWVVFLSGADFPIKPADKILHDLSTSQYDAHIHHEKIRYKQYEREWQELCYKRYCSLRFRIPVVTRRLKLSQRTIRFSHPFITTPFLPFSNAFSCFAGEHWFCANRTAAEYLLHFHESKPALANHYRRTERALVNYHRRPIELICPEESYYQTILCNAPHLRISQDHRRYIDWSQNAAHPKTLLMEDLPKLLASEAHFARKFDSDVDGKILDALDAAT